MSANTGEILCLRCSCTPFCPKLRQFSYLQTGHGAASSWQRLSGHPQKEIEGFLSPLFRFSGDHWNDRRETNQAGFLRDTQQWRQYPGTAHIWWVKRSRTAEQKRDVERHTCEGWHTQKGTRHEKYNVEHKRSVEGHVWTTHEWKSMHHKRYAIRDATRKGTHLEDTWAERHGCEKKVETIILKRWDIEKIWEHISAQKKKL